MALRSILATIIGVGICLSAGTVASWAQETKKSEPNASNEPKKAATPQQTEEAPEKKATPRASRRRHVARTEVRVPSSVIREPSQGRPIFVTPGETFPFVMSLPAEFKGDVGFALQHALEPGIRVPLRTATPPSYYDEEYCMIVFEVGAKVAPGLYDLVVNTEAGSYYARHSVKVVDRFKTKFRFVHLSNMNVGDLTAPDFDDMLPREINILSPEFIIATGDYTEWSRARDDASSWRRVLDYFAKFNAPVFMLCGLHDHEASFTKLVASKPIGKIDYGDYHGLLLLDHPGNPIDQDYAQIQWIEADLKRNRHKRMNFIATNSDELGLIDVWRERGDIQAFFKQNNIRMMIAGGSTDWDYKEFADKLEGLDELHFIRTHESSTCMRDRATGFSHYRVIEVDGDKLSYVYPNDAVAERLQHSIPTGRLRAFFDAPNDGSARCVGVTVQNALNQGFENARVWLRIAKQGDQEPIVAPGKLVRVVDAGEHWGCEVAFDLPDKGAVRIMGALNAREIPPSPPITASIEGPRDWAFDDESSEFGLSYFESDAGVTLKLTNNAASPLITWPVVRVNGAKIHPDRTAVPKLPLTIQPGETISLPLVLNLRRVSPGEHKLQVYFLEDPLSRLQTFNVNLVRETVASTGEPGNP